MKKIIISLMFAFTCFLNAQVNVTEGFEGTALPSGWVATGFNGIPSTAGFCSGAKSMRMLVSNTNFIGSITTSSYTSNGFAINVGFSYRTSTSSGTLGGNYILYYQIGTQPWVTAATSNVISGTCSQLSTTIPSGTVPNGSAIKFKIEAMTASNIIIYYDNFSAIQSLVATPAAPVAASPQSVCPMSFVSNLNATGTALKWYSDAAGVNELFSGIVLQNNTTYYVSQTVGGFESPTAAVLVIVNPTPPAPTAARQLFCAGSGARFSDIVTNGVNVRWFTTFLPQDGIEIAPTTLLSQFNVYYFTQTINGCQSARGNVAIDFNQVITPFFAGVDPICSGTPLTPLPTTSSEGVQGVWTPALNNLATTTYTFTPNAGQCSPTTTMTIVVNTAVAPTASAQTLTTGATVANLVASGTGLKWYNTLTGGAQLISTTVLSTGTYFVSQTVGTCVSTRTSVAVTVAAPTLNAPAITAVSSLPITTSGATINYSLNANNSATTSVVRYGTNAGSLVNSATGFSASGTTTTPGTASLTGLSANTQYFYRIDATNSAGTTPSAVLSFSTTAASSELQFSNLSSSLITNTTATVSVTVSNACAGSTYRLQYSTTQFFTADIGDVPYLTNGTNGVKDHTLTGLTTDAIYYFRFYSSPGQGCGNAAQILTATSSFRTTAPITGPIAEYLFNGTLSNVNGTEPFGITGTSYTADRANTANSALLINGGFPVASISNLPIGQASRTVSIWIRPTQVNADNIIFSYGSGNGDAAYGASFAPSIMYNFSFNSNLAFNTTTTVNTWKHMVYTFDRVTRTAKMYINGALTTSGVFGAWMTASGSSFYLGNLFAGGPSAYNGAIDDLKIYDRALSDTEILNLFNNNTTLSTSNFNQNNLQVAVYPNPVNNILNVEVATDLKSIEIYNIQGQKVLSSTQKQINITDLQTGIYMIKIEDTANAVATKKFVKQ